MPNYQNTFHNSKSKKRRYRRMKKQRHKNKNKHYKNQRNDSDIEEEEENQNDCNQINNKLNDASKREPSNKQSEEKKNDDNIVMIDGSKLEGGGQIVRNTISLSGLLSKGIIMNKIRGNRKTSGLRAQHKLGICLIHQIYGGILKGNYIKSNKIEFYPEILNKNDNINIECDMKTAGSISLLIQTVLPCLIFRKNKSNLIIKGGTNVFFSPSIDYIKFVLIPMLNKLFQIKIGIDIKKRGYFPKGGGHIIMNIKPLPINGILPCFNLTKRGKIIKIYGMAVIGGHKMNKNIGYQMIDGAVNELQQKLKCKENGINIDIKISQQKSDCIGSSIIIVAETDNGCLFGEDRIVDYMKNKGDHDHDINYFNVGINAAKMLIDDLFCFEDSCSDRWLQDQLIIFMALTNGISQFRTCSLSLHTKTAMYFVEKMTGAKFSVKEESKSVLIQCHGIGLKNKCID